MTSAPDLARLTIEDFACHCDAEFEMQTPAGRMPLKLLQVDPAGISGRKGGAFSLLFLAPEGQAVPQAIYPVKHPALGEMQIFLVPIGPLPGGIAYQAVFA